MGVFPESLLGLEEVDRLLISLEHLDRGGVEGCETTVGRGDSEVTFALELLVGVGKFGLCLNC